MKKLLLPLLLTIICTITTSAQSNNAQLEYFDAEKAYNNNDYVTALKKLDEAEKLLGKLNPKILYLRILSEDQIIKSDQKSRFNNLENLRKNSKYYLKTYQNIKSIKAKYEEIYKIAETAQEYPNSEVEYELFIEKKRLEKVENEIAINEKKDKELISEKFNKWDSTISGLSVGMNIVNVPSLTWNYLDRKSGLQVAKNQNGADRSGVIYTPKYSSFKFKAPIGLYQIFVDNETQNIVSITSNNFVGGKSDMDQAKNVYQTLKNKMIDYFGAEYVIEEEETKQIDKKSSYYTKKIKLNNKNLTIQYIISLQNFIYGGILGTECSVSETYTANINEL